MRKGSPAGRGAAVTAGGIEEGSCAEAMNNEHDRGFTQQLEGFRLATAEILYYMPDHPGVLQSFIWQHYDRAPDYPRLHKFLSFWHREIEAVLHSVTVGRKKLIAPPKVQPVAQMLYLH